MGWRVVDAAHAFAHAVAKGRTPYDRGRQGAGLPAIVGIGGSLIYFTDAYGPGAPLCRVRFSAARQARGGGVPLSRPPDPQRPQGQHGQVVRLLQPAVRLSSQIRFFDIEGKFTGLFSRALTSPCGRIRIPINEDRGETGQIVEYLRRYNGEGIQHIAVGTDDIYAATDEIAARGLKFMPKPPMTYYELSKTRVGP
jgi:4-hydroxyphenylpyruvate dioxygenase